MATKDEVKAVVNQAVLEVKQDIKAAIDKETLEVDAKLKALQDQIDNGSGVTQADLDEIRDSVKSISATVVPEVDAIQP